MKEGAILVLSGPSGAGKSTIINAASDEIGEYYFSISTTTRDPIVGEKN
jgi:guanylate kinase